MSDTEHDTHEYDFEAEFDWPPPAAEPPQEPGNGTFERIDEQADGWRVRCYADGSVMIRDYISTEGWKEKTIYYRPDGTEFRIDEYERDGRLVTLHNQPFDQPGPLQPDPPEGSMRTWWLPEGWAAEKLQHFHDGAWEDMGPGWPGNAIYAPNSTIFSVVDARDEEGPVPPGPAPAPAPAPVPDLEPEPLPPAARIDFEAIRAEHPLEEVIALDRGNLPNTGFVTCPRPEHRDSNPSTHLRDNDHWFCFGCQTGGDVLDWVAVSRGVSTREAVRLLEDGAPLPPELPKLATGAGVTAGAAVASAHTTIPAKPSAKREAPPGDRERCRAALKAAWDYYRVPKLYERAAGYVANRGIDVTVLEPVAGLVVGHTPAAPDGLTKQLLKRGFTEEELLAASLSWRKDEGSDLIDFFRQRLVLSFSDEHGVTGLIGRYDGDKPEILEKWKYKNSLNTAVANKGECLFWPVGRPKPGDRVVLVEGSLDALAVAIAAQVSGRLQGEQRIVPVAPSGVALSDAQWQTIMDCKPSRVAIALDNDDTGRKFAAERLEEARQRGLDARVVEWPEATKDAAGLLQAGGPSGVLKALGAKGRAEREEERQAVSGGVAKSPAAPVLDDDPFTPVPAAAPMEPDDPFALPPPLPRPPVDDPFVLVPTLPAPGRAWPEMGREAS